jgi:hypothetical protein
MKPFTAKLNSVVPAVTTVGRNGETATLEHVDISQKTMEEYTGSANPNVTRDCRALAPGCAKENAP